MTGVILRCPNCGTAKTSPGECEACHEAQVRYYCTNHKPGRWLDAPVCPQCGATFGEPIRPPAGTFPPAAPSRPKTAPPAPTRSETPPAPRASVRPWGRRERERPPEPRLGAEDGSASTGDPRAARMLEILRAASRASRLSRGATYTTPEAPPVGAVLGGCLMRFILLMMFLLILFTLMVSLLGGSLVQMFGPYSF
jgi:hypothetical protein